MQDAKEEVRSRLAIEDVIAEYVQLKRAGRLWRGLSPFTNEKTPSFFVTPDRNIWHDFSANKGGDIFTFIMEMEGLDFRGALELLARKAGVDLSQYDTTRSRDVASKKRRYLDANAVAVRYFQNALVKSTSALEYVSKKRQLTKETVIEWQIGYAPESGGLVSFLLGKEYKSEELRGAGLMSARGNDMFRGRMMVPLCDGQGQVVGFTGRIIGEGEPKYINTPATILYDKGRQVFGLHLAKKAIRENDFVVLVEGNLDVISSHQAGVKNVVAAAGTALTHDHLKSLSRLTANVRLCFDGDKAGIAATERAIPMADSLGLKLSVITLPADAKDPDELVQKGASKWQEAIENHKPAVQWVIDQYAGRVDLATADGKKTLTTEALKIVRRLGDPVEQEFYLKLLSRLTGASMSALEQKMSARGANEAKPLRLKKTSVEKQQIGRRDRGVYLNYIFAASLKYDEYRALLNNIPDEYLDKIFYQIREYLLNDTTGVLDDDDVRVKLAELELVADRTFDKKERSYDELVEYYRNLEILNYRGTLDSLKEQFASEEDDNKRALLNNTIKSLNKILRTLETTGAPDDFTGLFKVWGERKQHDVLTKSASGE